MRLRRIPSANLERKKMSNGIIFFSCNCNNAFVSDYNIYTRKNNLGDKELRISLKGQITNLVFLLSQRGLEHKDIYLRMVSN